MKRQKCEDVFGILDKGAISLIFRELPVKDALNLGATSKRLNEYLGAMWPYFLKRDYGYEGSLQVYKEEHTHHINPKKPFMLAYFVRRNDLGGIKCCRRAGVDPSNITLRLAVLYNCVDIVEYLLSFWHIDPACNENTTIQRACALGYTAVAALLLAHPKVDPTAASNRSIKRAAENGHTDVIRLLLADGRVDPSCSDQLPLYFAAVNGHKDCFDLLLKDDRVNVPDQLDEDFVEALKNLD